MTVTVPPMPAEWLAEPPTLDEISTVDGWQHYVEHRDDYQPPALLTRAEHDRLPDGHRSLYDMARETAIANLPRHDPPQGKALMEQVIPTLRANTANATPGVRTGLFVSADAGLGKSTLVREIAALFDTSLRQKAQFFPSVAGNRDRWIPVAWVGLGSEVTISGLCRDILAFYGDVPRSRTYEPELTARVRQIIIECGTRLLVLDDITRLKMHREADQNAADFIRALMEAGAAVLGIGVNVEQSGLLYEGHASTRSRRLLTQTRRPFTVHTLGLQAHPVNYGNRRRHLNAAWNIPEDDPQHLVDAMLAARVARNDTPWDERRRDVTIWLWSHITSGDAALAPMALTTTTSRRCTDQAINSSTTLRRRAAPMLEEIVTGYADRLSQWIDAPPSQRE